MSTQLTATYTQTAVTDKSWTAVIDQVTASMVCLCWEGTKPPFLDTLGGPTAPTAPMFLLPLVYP